MRITQQRQMTVRRNFNDFNFNLMLIILFGKIVTLSMSFVKEHLATSCKGGGIATKLALKRRQDGT